MPAALPQALVGRAKSELKEDTKFSCLDGFARQGTLFDKVSEDIQDRGIGLLLHLVYQVLKQLILQE